MLCEEARKVPLADTEPGGKRNNCPILTIQCPIDDQAETSRHRRA
jgi:hypothetical protein